MHLLHKGFMKDYLYWYTHGELFLRNESMIEKMIRSISSASNVYEVVNDNNNPYRNIVTNAMILMNHYGMTVQITLNYRSLHRCLSSSRIMG
jgi:hypothetical protein